MFDVCVVGSANLDLVATATRLPRPGETVAGSSYAEHAGGKGLNQAVAAARAGARVGFVGAIGDDAAGRTLRAALTTAGVDTSAVGVAQGVPTGRALITVDADAENSIVVVAGANATLTVDEVPPARVVLVQLETPLPSVTVALQLARRSGAITVLNPAPASRLDDDLLRLVDIVVPNEHEVDLLGGVDRLLRSGVVTIVTTRGTQGVSVVRVDDRWEQPPFAVDALDATAAGDSFCGYLAAGLAAGHELRDTVRRAAAAGALATTRRGAVASIPVAADVHELLSGGEAQPPSRHG